MNVYLIRHAEIENKYLGRYVGSTNASLSNIGRSQSKKLAGFLNDIHLDVIYISPLKRARQTAYPILKLNKTISKEDKRLEEIDFGPWEGKTFEEIQLLTAGYTDCSLVTSGGELYKDFVKRVRSFLQEIESSHRNDTILLITHKGVIREAYKYFLNDNGIIVDQTYGCINYLQVNDKKTTVIYTNKNCVYCI